MGAHAVLSLFNASGGNSPPPDKVSDADLPGQCFLQKEGAHLPLETQALMEGRGQNMEEMPVKVIPHFPYCYNKGGKASQRICSGSSFD